MTDPMMHATITGLPLIKNTNTFAKKPRNGGIPISINNPIPLAALLSWLPILILFINEHP
jgi:hypothetical protein